MAQPDPIARNTWQLRFFPCLAAHIPDRSNEHSDRLAQLSETPIAFGDDKGLRLPPVVITHFRYGLGNDSLPATTSESAAQRLVTSMSPLPLHIPLEHIQGCLAEIIEGRCTVVREGIVWATKGTDVGYYPGSLNFSKMSFSPRADLLEQLTQCLA